MGAGVCAALAQLAPVFMVLLVAERVVFAVDEEDTFEDMIENDEAWLAAGRIAVDLILAGLSAFLTISALVGIEAGGYTGEFANWMWVMTFGLIGLVILRWLFLATPFSALFTRYMRGQAKFLLDVGEGIADGLVEVPRALAVVPREVLATLADVGRGFLQFFAGLLSVGTAGRAPLTQVQRRRHERGGRGDVKN